LKKASKFAIQKKKFETLILQFNLNSIKSIKINKFLKLKELKIRIYDNFLLIEQDFFFIYKYPSISLLFLNILLVSPIFFKLLLQKCEHLCLLCLF
jgi:hypothetical protein